MEELSKEVVEENKKTVDLFLHNPDNKKLAVDLAHQIQKEMGDGWFEAKKLCKKFAIDINGAKTRFMVLNAFSLIAYKEQKGKQLYKIDLSQKDQRRLLLQEIEFHEAQIMILKEKLTKLS